MSTLTYGVWFNSGGSTANHYQKGDNLSLVSVTNSDQTYYQNGNVSLYNVPSAQTVGDSVLIEVNSTEQFTGYVSSRTQEIRGGVKSINYQLVGKTYDLWRYHTDDYALYSGTTAYIASSLVSSYCTGVSGGGVTVADGVDLANDIDLTNMTVGDAIVRLSKLDGYKFYVDNDGDLQYYFPGVGIYDFTVEESDIVDMTPVEESDSDIVNDVLVKGGSDYSSKTNVSDTYPNSKIFPSGILVAQRFEAEDPVLSAVKLYLDRSTDPNQPGELSFEIWDNTEITLFTDDFSNWNYISNSSNVVIEDGYLILDYTKEEEKQTTYEYNQPSREYNAQTFKFGVDRSPISASVYLNATDGVTAIVEIRPTGVGIPSGNSTVMTSGTVNTTGSYAWLNVVFSPKVKLSGNTTYALVIRRQDGSTSQIATNEVVGGGATYGNWYYSTDGGSWTDNPNHDIMFYVWGRKYNTLGVVSSLSYTNDTQYMKLDTGGIISSNRVYISGTNDGGTTWKTLPDNSWVDFGSESSAGTQVKYKLSSNGYYTPKIGSAELKIADSSGGFEYELFDDSFDDSSFLSSNSNSGMSVNNSILHLSGQNMDVSPMSETWLRAGYVNETTSHWTDDANIVDGNDTTYANNAVAYTTSAVFEFSGSMDLNLYKVEIKAYRGNTHNHIKITYVDVSSQHWGLGWVRTRDADYTIPYSSDYWNLLGEFYLNENEYYYNKIDKIRFGVESYNFGACTNRLYYFKFLCWRSYDESGNIKTDAIDTNINMEYMKLTSVVGNYSDKITYSGSLDNGSNWKKLTSGDDINFSSNPGNEAIVWYNFTPSNSSIISSSTRIPETPQLNSCKLSVWKVAGGGMPKSGSRIEWSDDISWTAGDIPYPSSYSSWQTYSTPKLSGLTKNDDYWMIFEHPSGSSKWWKYYYDSSSTYDGKICYSWDDGINWSSNSTQPADVPDGNMTFQLGWTQGDITATATNQTSIDSYGRHFKKITESNYTTLEQAQARADYEVSGMETIPMKGTLTIDGREDMSTEYRFSSNLTNFTIDEIWDIKSYTQTIDKRGFTTSINYGKHKFDISQKIAALEVEVSA